MKLVIMEVNAEMEDRTGHAPGMGAYSPMRVLVYQQREVWSTSRKKTSENIMVWFSSKIVSTHT